MYLTRLKQTFLTLGIALSFLSSFAVVPALAEQENSDRAEFPGRRIGGGTRGECITGTQPLVALNPANNLGLTASDQPSVYFLMPTLDGTYQVEFILRDREQNSVYQTSVDVDQTKKLVGIQLPKNTVAVDQDYHWYFSLICDAEDRSQNVVLSGWMRRVSPEVLSEDEAVLESNLNQVRSYQQAGLWIDAIATLVELRQTYPNNNEILYQWREVVQMLGLDTVVNQSLAGHL